MPRWWQSEERHGNTLDHLVGCCTAASDGCDDLIAHRLSGAVRTHHVSLVGDSDAPAAPAARAVEPAMCALVVASYP